jgi:hypothetical protein
MATELARMAQIYGTTADWAATPSIILLEGEMGLELRTDGKVWSKVGDGVTTYSLLPWMVGDYVLIAGPQTIVGVKTFAGTILIENQENDTRYAQLFSVDEPAGVHSVRLDSREVDGVAYITARNDLGEAITMAVFNDGNLYFRGNLIADQYGVGGSTPGRFDASGAILSGNEFLVGKLATGQYEISFTVPADTDSDQSVTANVQAGTGNLGTCTVQVIDASTVHIFTTDGAIAADQAVNFSRHFAPVPVPIS